MIKTFNLEKECSLCGVTIIGEGYKTYKDIITRQKRHICQACIRDQKDKDAKGYESTQRGRKWVYR